MVAKKSTTTKAVVTKNKRNVTASAVPQHIGLVKNDPYLEPYENAIRGRHDHAVWKIGQLTNNWQENTERLCLGS